MPAEASFTYAGATQQFVAVAAYADGTERDVTDEAEWRVSDPNLAKLIGAARLAAVADNGAGIPEDVQSHLFQPFFTTKGERGTGLGLWVSRGIINKHGGTISLTSDTSEAAHGTVVSVFLATNPTINAAGD